MKTGRAEYLEIRNFRGRNCSRKSQICGDTWKKVIMRNRKRFRRERVVWHKQCSADTGLYHSGEPTVKFS
jgi:hypothetical protein